jgi:Domain of unknown function (DUF1707)/2TM domain
VCHSRHRHHYRRHVSTAIREVANRVERDPDVRVGDADRERAASLLREHAAHGRLAMEELEERVAQAYAAKTAGDLTPLTRDLPPIRLPEDERAEHRADVRDFVSHLTTYLVVILLLVGIWAASGADGHFWPIWPALGWGIGLFSHASSLRPKQRRTQFRNA